MRLFLDHEGEARLWTHWQNLVEDAKGNPRGFPWHGRGWLHIEPGGQVRGSQLGVEWSLGPWAKSAGVSLTVDPHGEDVVAVSVKVWKVLGLHLSLGTCAKWVQRLAEKVVGESDVTKSRICAAKEFSIRFFDNAIWWNIWTDPGGWTNSRPRWRDGNWHPANTFLGKLDYASVELKHVQVEVPMPENVYHGLVTLTEDTWKRPRWFATRRRSAKVEMHTPIPVPGKGENSWDCGEDAIHSLSTQARTVSEAIGAVVTSATRSRERHGGLAWRPAAKEIDPLPVVEGVALAASREHDNQAGTGKST